MQSVTPNPEVKQAITLPSLSLTEAKVQRFAHAFFGILSIVLANFLYGFGGLIAFASLPLYLITITFAIRFFQVKDYSKPEKIQAYRDAAIEQTFEEVLRDHGLFNAIKYEIIPLHELNVKLEQYLIGLQKPGKIASFYLKFQNIAERCGLSMENFRPVFVQAVGQAIGSNVTEVFASGQMQELIQAGFPTKALLGAYQEFQKAEKTYNDELNELMEAHSMAFWKDTVLPFVTKVDAVEPKTPQIQEWVNEVKRDLTYLILGERKRISQLKDKVGDDEACRQFVSQNPMQFPIAERAEQELKLWSETPDSFSSHPTVVQDLDRVRENARIWVGNFNLATKHANSEFTRVCSEIDSRWTPS